MTRRLLPDAVRDPQYFDRFMGRVAAAERDIRERLEELTREEDMHGESPLNP